MSYLLKQWYLLISIILVGLMLLYVRSASELMYEVKHINPWSKEYSELTDKMLAGPIPGIFSDFFMLDVFSVYYDAEKSTSLHDMQYINIYLNRAQKLDPDFFDVYRLAGSILAYDADMPRASIDLLEKGIVNRPDIWEFPFYAGFIAHDLLKNDKLAYELMSQVAEREGTPTMVITLASRFLELSSTKEDAIVFLQGLLQLLPENNRVGIRNRITELKKGK